jgi:CRP-like cAMP-binding protein
VPGIRKTAPVNQLLAALPPIERKHFIARCEAVELISAQALAAPGERLDHVYFPTGSVISLTTRIAGHSSVEVGLIGDEGMFGISAMLDADISLLSAHVQGKGRAWRMSVESFRDQLSISPPLQRVLKRYLHVMTGQFAQAAACMRFHVVEARLACWLLMMQDRTHSDRLHGTHEHLAFMLGVRRVGVTRAASSLQSLKLISYTRGDIRILDRSGLEAASCGCYLADKAMYARILEA